MAGLAGLYPRRDVIVPLSHAVMPPDVAAPTTRRLMAAQEVWNMAVAAFNDGDNRKALRLTTHFDSIVETSDVAFRRSGN